MNQKIMFIVALAVILALVVLILLLKRSHEIEKHDNELIRQYNKEREKIRKERILQEQEKQRRIRGEPEDAPKYAAGDQKDRINRQSYFIPGGNAPEYAITAMQIAFTGLLIIIITAIISI